MWNLFDRTHFAALLLALAIPLLPAAGNADEESNWSLRGGLGFTASPGSFLLSAEAPYSLDPHVTIGPLLQLGFSGDDIVVAPTANLTYSFDLGDNEVRPFIQGGPGLVYLRKERGFGTFDDTGFMLNFGGGLEFPMENGLVLGTNLMFNVMPWNVAGDHFFFSWQMLTVRFGL